MLNYIWAFMILIGVVFGALTGNMEQVSKAALDSAGEAVSLCITMIGVMALWVGLMQIAQKSGLIAKLTRGIQPFISFLFPFKMDSRSLETYPYKGADRTRIEIRVRRNLPHKNVVRIGFRPCVLQIVNERFANIF